MTQYVKMQHSFAREITVLLVWKSKFRIPKLNLFAVLRGLDGDKITKGIY